MVLPVPSWCHESRTFTHGNIWDRDWGTPFFVLNIQVDITKKIGIEHLSVLTFWTSKWMFWDCSHFFRIIQCFLFGLGLWYSNSLYQHLKLLTKCCALSITLRFCEAQRIWAVADSQSVTSRHQHPLAVFYGHQWDLSGKNLRWHSNREQNQSGWKGHRYPQLLSASQSSSSWTWKQQAVWV